MPKKTLKRDGAKKRDEFRDLRKRQAVIEEHTHSDDYLLAGIAFPEKPKHHPDFSLKEAWLAVTHRLMSRGVNTAWELAKLTGIKVSTCQGWINEINARWQLKMHPDAMGLRRETLYQEAEEAFRLAMDSALKSGHPKHKAQFLKIALAANARKAALYGLDTLKVEIDATVSGSVDANLQPSEFQTKYGVDRATVREMGRLAAKGLSAAASRTLEAELVDAQAEAANAVKTEIKDETE